jgi:senataxin
MKGCKLWLRATLSPSVMRNTLLGQCFHTKSEKIHKAIFDLFQPLLQSLEALRDGEHEKQRRHFLYFLLHQVPVSSNFSLLARRIGHKIALLIVLRGYKMNPPCPPFECAHMWLVQLGLSVVLHLFVASVTYLRNWLFFHPWF